ncbi:hypothetical protein NDU88_010799 [Pleurodeles waltl]|uniref:Uncharacterized protein n=1 Tax=Pleurodeles waltl TaxID=8319 RepID=A0AAV7QVE0_PLEWA|nr:hypothetical protein NDU88_010799 [Pleurodeles waltl]
MVLTSERCQGTRRHKSRSRTFTLCAACVYQPLCVRRYGRHYPGAVSLQGDAGPGLTANKQAAELEEGACVHACSRAECGVKSLTGLEYDRQNGPT